MAKKKAAKAAKKKTTRKAKPKTPRPDPVREKAAALLHCIREQSLEVQVGQRACREMAEALGQSFSVQHG